MFGAAGWSALNADLEDGTTVGNYILSLGKKVLKLPHFSQNQQQRELYLLNSGEEEKHIRKQKKPQHYERYKSGAIKLRIAVQEEVQLLLRSRNNDQNRQ